MRPQIGFWSVAPSASVRSVGPERSWSVRNALKCRFALLSGCSDEEEGEDDDEDRPAPFRLIHARSSSISIRDGTQSGSLNFVIAMGDVLSRTAEIVIVEVGLRKGERGEGRIISWKTTRKLHL